MAKKLGFLIFVSLLLGFLVQTCQLQAVAARPRVAQVVYLTLSQACGCILDRCKAGDWVVDKVFVGQRQSLLKRIDYSTDKEAARQYIRKYRITLPPAIIFLDSQGGELWRAMGEIDLAQVETKLREFGVRGWPGRIRSPDKELKPSE